MNILVINAGSSSLKYQLLNPETGALLAKGLCERIGIDGKFTYKPQVEGKKVLDAVDVAMPTHSEAIQAVLDALVDKDNGVIGSMKEIDAVGHRVVHGGEAFAGSVLITDEVMKALEDCIPLAPLHNPANITGINACTAVMGKDVPQVAVFDTAFHQTMPAKAFMYALPYEYYEKDKVRRYGFHGTSHKYVSGRAAAMLGKKPEELKLISCHLGNGSSVTAIDGGKSVDTSMGFTPLAGVPMGTRSGDLDAGILQYLMNKYGMNIDEMLNILNKKSGVQGVSGVSSDFRDLENAHKEGNERAGLGRGYVQLRREEADRCLCRRHGRGGCHHLHRRRGRELRLPADGHRLRSGVHGREDGRRGQQRPRQGGRHLRRRLQGEGPADPHQRGAHDRHRHRRHRQGLKLQRATAARSPAPAAAGATPEPPRNRAPWTNSGAARASPAFCRARRAGPPPPTEPRRRAAPLRGGRATRKGRRSARGGSHHFLNRVQHAGPSRPRYAFHLRRPGIPEEPLFGVEVRQVFHASLAHVRGLDILVAGQHGPVGGGVAPPAEGD